MAPGEHHRNPGGKRTGYGWSLLRKGLILSTSTAAMLMLMKAVTSYHLRSVFLEAPQSQEDVANVRLTTIEDKIRTYFLHYRRLVSSLQEFYLQDPYLKVDAWGEQLRFVASVGESRYELSSAGGNGRFGDDDDLRRKAEVDGLTLRTWRLIRFPRPRWVLSDESTAK